MDAQLVTLQGRVVRLEPLSLEHLPGLSAVGREEDLWKWTQGRVTTPEAMQAYIKAALNDQKAGRALPFATLDRTTGQVVGSTRFLNLDPADRRAEIGATWLGGAWQRTAFNTEAKYLMLRHAFEVWECIRVELKTDALNQRLRAAILRLGAREEGTLRNHMITESGRIRHTVYYSIIDSEWPGVKAWLEERLSAGTV
jgi:RimJ/RimL family protein N-acetyltransferase